MSLCFCVRPANGLLIAEKAFKNLLKNYVGIKDTLDLVRCSGFDQF